MHAIDTLIHIGEELDGAGRSDLLGRLERMEGVDEVGFAPHHGHLLQVKYDGGMTDAMALLEEVRARGLKAHLIAL